MNQKFEKLGFYPADILLPKGQDMTKWAVVACDQFTSEPEYWQAVEQQVGDAPSTLRLILPEAKLKDPNVDEYIAGVNRTMDKYLADDVFTLLPQSLLYVEREQSDGRIRHGLIGMVDLDAYDFTPGSGALIRATEGTVLDRIPPRARVRRGAPIELPHVMLLIDDPDRTVIEPLFALTGVLRKQYDVELMQNGGHLNGWFIPEGPLTAQVAARLDALNSKESFDARYGLTGDHPILAYAVGDGNHSMATAKANWEEIKATLSPAERENHPARFVLAELVNIHDESLVIEGIHRALFGVDPEAVLAAAKAFFAAHDATATIDDAPRPDCQSFPIRYGEKTVCLNVDHSPWALPVASLQNFLDDLLPAVPDARIDYIHGLDALDSLAAQPGCMGFRLPAPSKTDLFRGVILDGVLPRKTFSMGEAHEKRFYMEARKITR